MGRKILEYVTLAIIGIIVGGFLALCYDYVAFLHLTFAEFFALIVISTIIGISVWSLTKNTSKGDDNGAE